MPGTTNFIQVNPNANNQESDATYAGDTQRSGGMAINSPFSSALANKIFYQASTFYTAFANMMTSKGFSPNDGSAVPASALANLQAVFTAIACNATDIANLLGYTPANDSKLNQLNNIRVQQGNGSGGSIVFPVAFSSAPSVSIVEFGGSCNLISVSTTGFTYNFAGSGVVSWIAVGPK